MIYFTCGCKLSIRTMHYYRNTILHIKLQRFKLNFKFIILIYIVFYIFIKKTFFYYSINIIHYISKVSYTIVVCEIKSPLLLVQVLKSYLCRFSPYFGTRNCITRRNKKRISVSHRFTLCVALPPARNLNRPRLKRVRDERPAKGLILNTRHFFSRRSCRAKGSCR